MIPPLVNTKVKKSRNILWAYRRVYGEALVYKIYVSITGPSITFASLLWWPGCQTAGDKKRLSMIRILLCLGITGTVRTAPTGVMEALTWIPPLDLVVQGEARSAAHRLWSLGFRSYLQTNSISMWLPKSEPTFNPYPTAFPYGNGMVLHFYQQQESSTTKTVHKIINKGLKAYV